MIGQFDFVMLFGNRYEQFCRSSESGFGVQLLQDLLHADPCWPYTLTTQTPHVVYAS